MLIFFVFNKCHRANKNKNITPYKSSKMISIFSIIFFWILFIVNRVAADQCIRKSSCECNYEDGFGYDLSALGKPGSPNFEANSTSSVGMQYIFRPCNDNTVLPPYQPITTNNCNSGFAVNEQFYY